jgi:CDP-diacylglycerol---glycerol-3-phosphate 3-phosphatidyltransferase
MANLVTLSRLLVLLVVVWLFYQPPTPWAFAGFLLIVFIFVSDGLDGYIARRRNEASLFGALFDIAGDRIVELTLWIVAADLDLVPIFVPIVFIIRGVIVDTIRSSYAAAEGAAPFAFMRSPLGKFIVGGKLVRIVYAVAKAAAFAGLALLMPLPALLPDLWSRIGGLLTALTYFFVYLSVLLCIARGLPVIAEFVQARKSDILIRPSKKQ